MQREGDLVREVPGQGDGIDRAQQVFLGPERDLEFVMDVRGPGAGRGGNKGGQQQNPDR